MSVFQEPIEDMSRPMLRVYVGDENEPDGPDDSGPNGLDFDSGFEDRRRELEAFWAGRNRANRRSAKVAA